MKTNAKQEFLGHITDRCVGGRTVRCAKVNTHHQDGILPVGYTSEDLGLFLKEIDFNYDSGYGGQELYGTIWYTDGTWSSRGEYDGSEWWEYNQCPEITPDLLGDPDSNV